MKKLPIYGLLITVLLFLFYFYITDSYKDASPTLYVNGHFITMDENAPIASSMLVKDGIIKELRNNDDILNDEVRIVDLNGATVMPGFIDPHSHFALSMFFHNMVDLSGFRHQTNEEVWSYFREQVEKTPPGDWILCKGIDPVLVDDLVMPSMDFMDEVAPDNPVILFAQSLHSYWANSRAYELAGVTLTTPNPNEHSFYERDAEGQFTGLIVEQQAFLPFLNVLKEDVLTSDELTSVSDQVMKAYAKWGNTTIVSAGLTIEDGKPLILTEHLSIENPTLMGSILEKMGYLPERQPTPRHFIYIRHDMLHLLPETGEDTNDFYGIIGVKHWYDGSPYIGSMYIDEPYLNTVLSNDKLMIPRHSRGAALIDRDTLKSFIKKYHNKNWQIAIHAQGDAAIKEILDVYEELEKELNYGDSRHRLEHCLLLPVEELDRLKRLGISPSFHVNHLYYYGDGLRDSIIGVDRADKMLPIRSTRDRNIPFSLHADQPMFESQPFRLIQTAVERKTRSGKTIGEEEKISLMDAIKALTIDAAWQIGKEDKIGSLEVGKYADFIVLDRNPFNVSTNELESIKCEMVFINGNKVIFN